MKRTILAGLLVLGAVGFAHAQTHPATVGHPFGLGTKAKAHSALSAVAPATAASSLTGDPLKDILNQILNVQGKVVSDLNQALTTQASVINPSTGSAWDPFSVMCLSGIPAIGTEGQPGFVSATPGLIAWVQGLTAPAVSAVPPLPGPKSAACVADMAATPTPASDPAACASPSAATLAVHARLLIMAANSDVATVLTQVNTTGIPSNLKRACGSLINDATTQTNTLISQGTAFAALLAQFVK